MGPKTMFDDLKEAAASGRYKSRFNADLYRQVRDGLCDNTANRILDAALDVCGSPHFAGAERRLWKYARRSFSEARCAALQRFLRAFDSSPVGAESSPLTSGR
jgi:hypothetical protein